MSNGYSRGCGAIEKMCTACTVWVGALYVEHTADFGHRAEVQGLKWCAGKWMHKGKFEVP